MPGDRTIELLRHLARQPGHDEVKADFRALLREEFGVSISDVEFERRDPAIMGRLDALIGRTVFEAKRDLAKERDDVVRRMPDYLESRERENGGARFTGIASDGKRWEIFELNGGALVTVKTTTLDPDKPDVFLAWLDGVLALKAELPPNALTIRAELGGDSLAYRRAATDLTELWDKLKDEPAVALKRQLWAQLLKLVHGKDVDSNALWFQHTFLVVVAKAIAFAVLDLKEDDPAKLLSGEAFRAAGIKGAVESDFFDWVVAHPDGDALVRRLMAHIRRFRLHEVETNQIAADGVDVNASMRGVAPGRRSRQRGRPAGPALRGERAGRGAPTVGRHAARHGADRGAARRPPGDGGALVEGGGVGAAARTHRGRATTRLFRGDAAGRVTRLGLPLPHPRHAEEPRAPPGVSRSTAEPGCVLRAGAA